MRKLPVLVGTVAALALTLTFTSSSVAQQERGSSGDEGGKKAMTIRGVVAEITVEGEFIVDYRQNKAVEAEAAFLTVVGAPKESKEGGEGRAAATGQGDKESHASGKRDNIYIVWLTPKTKVCKYTGGSKGEKHEAAAGSRSSEKKECSLDELEVGDHVEIQFIPREESDKAHTSVQNDKMRQTHGRNRTFVGYAAEVTIEEPAGKGSSGSDRKDESRQ